MLATSTAASTFAVHVDCDNLWIYETEYGIPLSDHQDLLYAQALPAMLDIFARWNIRATFFVIGSELKRKSCVDFCRASIAAGHRIANHTFNHRIDFPRLDAQQKRAEIANAHEAITQSTGQKPIGFRAPAYHVDGDIIRILTDLGYRYDSSSLPGPSNILMKAYMTSVGRAKDKSFGPWTAMFARQRAYRLDENATPSLWEFPIATSPLLRLPIHSTFVFKLGNRYFDNAIRRLTRQPGHHVYLLHAIDAIKHPCPERFLGKVVPLNLTFDERCDYLNRLGSRLRGRVVLTEELAAA